ILCSTELVKYSTPLGLNIDIDIYIRWSLLTPMVIRKGRSPPLAAFLAIQ
ncbi:unnamed protein product, partial [marine sediment metagenome]